MPEKCFDFIFGLVATICKIMICVQVIAVTIVFVGRYVFNRTPPWGEELTLFCLVWISLVGASLPLRNNTHLRMTLLEYFASPKVVKVLEIAGNILMVLFSVVLLVSGVLMTKQVSGTILHGMRISKGYLYAAVPAASIFFLLAFAEKLLIAVRRMAQEQGEGKRV